VTERILIKGGIVLTQDDALGELNGADVLVEDDRIAEVGRDLSVADARVIDAAGDIVIPGFIDTHRHTWETSIRTCAPDYPLITYFGSILDKFAPALPARGRPRGDPVGCPRGHQRGHHRARRLGAHHQHPDHADAGVNALQESGIRSVYAYGFGNTSLVDWWFGPDYTGSVLRIDGPDARRIRQQYFASDDGRVTMGLATRGTGFCKPDVVKMEWELAKELGINITGPRRDGPLWLHRRARSRPCATWTCSTPTRPTSTPRTSPTRSGPSSATPAGTSRSRRRSRSRWAMAGRRR
jgi:cytosine/adenosine deaminase-related metal-dependent hydrolase